MHQCHGLILHSAISLSFENLHSGNGTVPFARPRDVLTSDANAETRGQYLWTHHEKYCLNSMVHPFRDFEHNVCTWMTWGASYPYSARSYRAHRSTLSRRTLGKKKKTHSIKYKWSEDQKGIISLLAAQCHALAKSVTIECYCLLSPTIMMEKKVFYPFAYSEVGIATGAAHSSWKVGVIYKFI